MPTSSMLIISTSLDPKSRSRTLASLCAEKLGELGTEAILIDLRDYNLPPFDNVGVYQSPIVRELWSKIAEAKGIVLASPIYNWGCCAELKKLIEITGSTDNSIGLLGAWYDKILTFVNSAGLPHSYMAFGSLAVSMMLDYKCVINPYNVYIEDRQWQGGVVTREADQRISKSMLVMSEMVKLLSGRTYRSKWEI